MSRWIKLELAFCLACALLAPVVWARSLPVAGIVFVDKNGDGKLSPDEQGLAGAVVSDGVNVYKTDAQGRFAFIAVTDAMLGESALPMICLSMPDGYRATTPWFVRLTEPGQSDQTIHFGITPQTQPKPFEFVHVTDVHAAVQGGKQWTAFTGEMKAGAADYRFIIDTGDEGDLPDRQAPAGSVAEEEAALRIFQPIGIPNYHTAGNHDVMAGAALKAGWKADSPDFGYGLFYRLFGPSRWSFTYAGIHFVGIDTVATNGQMGKPTSGQDWLAKDLAMIPADMPVYLFGHHFGGWEKVLARRPIRYVFYGHMHDDEITVQNGTTMVQSCSLGRVHQINRQEGYRVVRVESDASIQSIYRFAGLAQAVVFDQVPQAGVTSQTLASIGYVYGLTGESPKAAYEVGGIRGDCEVEARPLCLSVKADVPWAKLPCGYYPLVITATSTNATVAGHALFLNRAGENPAPAGAQGAKLHLAIGGVDVPATVLVNGQEVGHIAPTRNGGDKYSGAVKWTQVFSFDVPAAFLLRLNTVSVNPGIKPDGVKDKVFMSFLWIERDGQVYKDMRERAYGRFYPFSADQYLDLTMPLPDPQGFRRQVETEAAPEVMQGLGEQIEPLKTIKP